MPLLVRRFLIFGALIGACSWIGAAVYLGELMVRLPRKPLPPQPRWAVAAPEQVEIRASDGIRLRGWFFRAPEPNGSSVILLHGQTDNRAGALGFADFMLLHGFNALTPDIRAHGESEGTLATYGLREADDLRRWVDWLRVRQPGAPVFGAGESMGAAILLQTLSVEQRFCAVMAEAPYANLREIAYDRLWQRWGYGPWRYLLRPVFELALFYQRARYGVDLDRVSPEEAVAHSGTPVLLIYGSRDENTPPRHARSIYQKNPASVTVWEVPGAGHTGAWGSRPQEFERRMVDWFSRPKCP